MKITYPWSIYLLLLIGFVAPVQASKVTKAMSEDVYKKLTSVQALIEKNQYKQALNQLTALTKEKISPYEQAQTWNLIAYSYYLQNKYKNAIKAYEKVLSEPELPEAMKLSTLKTISQLYLMTENYEKAIESANTLLPLLKEADANTLMILGQAYYQLGQYKKALSPTKKALALEASMGKKPNENWLQLLSASYQSLKEYKPMISVLEQLNHYYPKVHYMNMMAAVYSELGDNKKQLSIMEALYDGGHLTKANELNNLAILYLQQGVPYKAAKLLEKEINNGRLERSADNLNMLARAWFISGDDIKSVEWFKVAAKVSQSPDIYLRLAYSYFHLGNWKEAESNLLIALDKNKNINKGDAWLMLGMAQYRQKRLKSATSSFEYACKFKRNKKAAEQWLTYVKTEEQRLNELKAYRDHKG